MIARDNIEMVNLYELKSMIARNNLISYRLLNRINKLIATLPLSDEDIEYIRNDNIWCFEKDEKRFNDYTEQLKEMEKNTIKYKKLVDEEVKRAEELEKVFKDTFGEKSFND